MEKFIKRLSAVAVIGAIAFLLIQVFCDLYIPTLTAGMVNNGITAYIWQQGGIMLLITLLGFAATLLNTNITAKISYWLGFQLRRDIFRKTSQFSNDEFDKIGTSSLITRNTNDVTQVQNLIEMGLKFLILAPLYLIGGMIMAYRLSPALSTVFLVILPVVAVSCIGISLYANPLFVKMQKNIDRLNLVFREGLNGVKVIRIEIGTMMGVISYSMQILMGFMLITNVISSIPRGITSAKRINEVLDMPLSIRDIAQTQEIGKGKLSLRFDKVSYRYQGAEKNAVGRTDSKTEKYEGNSHKIVEIYKKEQSAHRSHTAYCPCGNSDAGIQSEYFRECHNDHLHCVSRKDGL
jgi:ATP-binding cassette subfamily B protein